MISAPPPPTGTPLVSFAGLSAAFAGWRHVYIFVVIMNVTAVTVAAAGSAIGAWAVSTAILGTESTQLWAAAALVGAAVVIRGLCSWLESWLGHDLSFRMMSRVRSWIFAAIVRLAPAGIAHRRTGDLATTTMTDAEALEIFYAHSSIYILSAAISTPLLWVVAATVNLPAALGLLPVLVLGVAVPLSMRRFARRHGEQIRSCIAELGAEVNENLGAVREITGYSMVAERLRRVAVIDERLARVQLANARRAGLENAAAGVIAVLAALVGAAVGANQVNAGDLAPEMLTPLIVLCGASPAAIVQWIAVTRHYGTTGQAAVRIEEVLYALPTVDRTGTADVGSARAARLDLENVSFTWPAKDPGFPARPAVLGACLSVQAGERVALAGRSGAGKSTLGALMARFMDPDTGRVEVDGTDLRLLSETALARAVSLVPQEVYLFTLTIRENLLLAVEDNGTVTEADLWDALETARAADLVRRLPAGLDTLAGGSGAVFSGGERQRLALARSILGGSRVLILDEAVSALDVSSEKEIRESFAAARTEQTTIVIAHRLSTLLSAERVIVLEGGRIVGDGTHTELLVSCPAYYGLVAPQLGALIQHHPPVEDQVL
ncbi:ABC transporter ATP-binding protein [Arthrobacter flavus]|uniref:ABC transporter ATP-binding protein n=1 Tax=Arthrobacter flavus TaxID=95172 RepID=A0ABW4Q4Z1_9MICC